VPVYQSVCGPDYPIECVLAVPISTYGVILYSSYSYGTYLYKHSGTTRVENAPLPENVSVTASPNPFSSSTLLTLQAAKGASVHIFNLQGKMVADLSRSFDATGSAYWDSGKFPSGLYLLKIMVGNRELTQKLILQR
jgi:hypothetical protein